MKDLCPYIRRQRLVIEAIVSAGVMTESAVKVFAVKLTDTLGMRRMADPVVCSFDETFGDGKFAGTTLVMPWMESALQIHTWENYGFLSIDIYTCKRFESRLAVDLVKQWFNPTEIEYEEIACS